VFGLPVSHELDEIAGDQVIFEKNTFLAFAPAAAAVVAPPRLPPLPPVVVVSVLPVAAESFYPRRGSFLTWKPDPVFVFYENKAVEAQVSRFEGIFYDPGNGCGQPVTIEEHFFLPFAGSTIYHCFAFALSRTYTRNDCSSQPVRVYPPSRRSFFPVFWGRNGLRPDSWRWFMGVGA